MNSVVFQSDLLDSSTLPPSGRRSVSEELRGTLAAMRAEMQGRPSPKWLEQVLRARKLRHRFFTMGLFADPAWDMLLDLYAAELKQRRVQVTSLCIASHSPTTTALRHIAVLTENGLIRKFLDPLDSRRKFVELTPKAIEAMERYFSSIAAGSVPL